MIIEHQTCPQCCGCGGSSQIYEWGSSITMNWTVCGRCGGRGYIEILLEDPFYQPQSETTDGECR